MYKVKMCVQLLSVQQSDVRALLDVNFFFSTYVAISLVSWLRSYPRNIRWLLRTFSLNLQLQNSFPSSSNINSNAVGPGEYHCRCFLCYLTRNFSLTEHSLSDENRNVRDQYCIHSQCNKIVRHLTDPSSP